MLSFKKCLILIFLIVTLTIGREDQQEQIVKDSHAMDAVTANSTKAPSNSPSASPTESPTSSPTTYPTNSPTKNPTNAPTNTPTNSPSANPTQAPTNVPIKNPTNSPTHSPTAAPTNSPSNNPTATPTNAPSNSPTKSPTNNPTATPTNAPSNSPTMNPTASPTASTKSPTTSPTQSPSQSPTSSPTPLPTKSPTKRIFRKAKFNFEGFRASQEEFPNSVKIVTAHKPRSHSAHTNLRHASRDGRRPKHFDPNTREDTVVFRADTRRSRSVTTRNRAASKSQRSKSAVKIRPQNGFTMDKSKKWNNVINYGNDTIALTVNGKNPRVFYSYGAERIKESKFKLTKIKITRKKGEEIHYRLFSVNNEELCLSYQNILSLELCVVSTTHPRFKKQEIQVSMDI